MMIVMNSQNDEEQRVYPLSSLSYIDVEHFNSICLLAGEGVERPYGMWSNFGQTASADQGTKQPRLS